ncbi:MAG: heat-inducible transcription repressor HrcA [Chloroflexi bacterium]|nr:heat-inducible transcription repressor HrcA [Chloroflexota bacterium]
MMTVLSERQKLVLALLVRDYVETAEPISSGRLVNNYRLDFSSATVRNEMAVLEQSGFLFQPYTSAGRVPTKAGYRYYVQQLMGEDQLPAHIQEMIRHQFYQARHDVDDWLSLSASVLAQHSQGAAIVTPLHTEKAQFKHISLLSTRGRQVLVVIILNSGEVHQQTLVLEETINQDQLTMVAARINQLAAGMDANELDEIELEDESSLLKEIFGVVHQTIKASEVISSGEVYRDGLANMLSEPEFSEPEKAKQTLEIFEDRVMLDDLLSRTVFDSDAPGVHVIIGGEDTWKQLEETSLILASYGAKDHAMGAVGILGPLRMSYSRGVSTVRFVSELISELISESMSS